MGKVSNTLTLTMMCFELSLHEAWFNYIEFMLAQFSPLGQAREGICTCRWIPIDTLVKGWSESTKKVDNGDLVLIHHTLNCSVQTGFPVLTSRASICLRFEVPPKKIETRKECEAVQIRWSEICQAAFHLGRDKTSPIELG